jgi:endoglucanase
MPQNLPLLKVPGGDRNIILSFHTYMPLLFTHYKADWVPIKVYTGPVHYPGPVVDEATFAKLTKDYDAGLLDQVGNAAEVWNAARLRKECEPAIRTAREHGLQLYCGEFGCLPTVPRADRLAYYRDIVSVCEGDVIAYANWEYKGDFGIYEWLGLPKLTGAPDFELIRILAPQASR